MTENPAVKKYEAEQITVLTGLTAVRKRPAMYIGDVSLRGLHHLVYEIVDNSIDEAMAGFCTRIKVVLHPDNSVTVIDNGRGIPVSIHPKYKISAVEVVLTKLHGGGKFDLNSGLLTSGALFFYSIGLTAYGGTKILQACFFALKDTVTPTKNSILNLLMNIGLIVIFIFIFRLKISGIALATSISGICSFLVLFFVLFKRLGGFEEKRIAESFLRILAASLGMGLVCFWVEQELNIFWALPAGAVAYLIFCFIFKVSEMRELWAWFLRPKFR